jgi:type II secretory pathway component PulF
MMRTLEILGNSQNPALGKMFQSIRAEVEAGISLSEAFRRVEGQVGRVVVSTIEAAEESGTLANSLEFLADNIERDLQIRQKLRKALAYPAVTGLVTLAIFLLCLVFVVPQFASLYVKLGVVQEGTQNPNYPGMTAIVIGLSSFLRHYFWLWIPMLVLACWGMAHLIRANPEQVDRAVLKIPILNRLLVLSDLSRFTDRLGLLLKSGVPIMKSISLAKETVANRVLKPRFARMADLAERGESLSGALIGTPHLSVGVVDMIQVGEEAGALPTTLSLAARNLRREMDRLYERLTIWAQPVGLFIVSGMVLTLILALFLPYLDLINAIGDPSVVAGMPGAGPAGNVQ